MDRRSTEVARNQALKLAEALYDAFRQRGKTSLSQSFRVAVANRPSPRTGDALPDGNVTVSEIAAPHRIGAPPRRM